jgi:DNA-binding beta-propeller fold protein YncE
MAFANRMIRCLACCALLTAVFLGGCKTTKEAPKKYTFFPPAPNEPRIQFLTSFSSDLDLGRNTSFLDYVTGRPVPPVALGKPYGLACKNGSLYVCDTITSGLQVFDFAKKRARNFMPRAEGRLQTPINISIDEDGTRYVADTGRSQVVIFGSDDSYQTAIGMVGEIKPTDVAIGADRLYITDLKDHCVKVFGKADRKLMFTIPRDPKAGEGRLFSPTNLALDKEGRLWVTDTGAFVVQIYDSEGRHLRTIGQLGVGAGHFARPKGIAVDREGRAYVVDASTQLVQLFDADGKLLMFFGQPGASLQGELYLPAAVKVDYDNARFFQQHLAPGFSIEYLIFVTSQFGDNKVSVYGFLKKK